MPVFADIGKPPQDQSLETKLQGSTSPFNELAGAIVDSLLKQFAQSSQLGANADYIEGLYEQYLVSPDSVGPNWPSGSTRP